MIEQLYPACGFTIVGEAHEKEGVKCCCEPCADASGPCQCGCCHPVQEGREER